MALDKRNKAQIFPRIGKFSMAIIALLFIISGFRAYEIFGFIFKPIVQKDAIVLVQTGATYTDVEELLQNEKIIENAKAFRWVARKKKYKQHVKPGRYQVKKGWNTNVLVNKLRIGDQLPVKVTFNNVRFFEELAGKVSVYFEQDSIAFLNAFNNTELQEKYDFNSATFSAMFIPNTYEVYWNTSPEKFIDKMHREYLAYWTMDNKDKAKKYGLSPLEVSILASIVQEETIKENEKAKVAGLYINRIKKGMLLQADPTIKFAIHDFSIRRVTNKMLEVDSPYNTYKNIGLPPGPINFPELSSIEAVLEAEKHSYLYMCAKEDFSGYHNFAKNLRQHNVNAAKYRSALNKNKIWR
ncbi:MAG: endolytic transglycosylase MltG [Prolixibacteraceae bacterium]|jgi:UPF0755 protein|nr:endolytic transglycosylase MltG [Prolixibacteraceae bacterium]